ncbi:MAG: type II toxin-antitoxin system RelE/ParE family toxin [Planctomycetota bacterium]
MSYVPELSDRAVDDLKRLDENLRSAAIDAIYELCEAPVLLSRPASTPPYPPGFQCYEVQVRVADIRYQITVLFKYSDDETSLLIYRIGHVRYKT